MKTGFLIAGMCAALAAAGCSSPGNGSGGIGNQSELTYGGSGTPERFNPPNPTTDPRGGWQNWRSEGGIDRSEPHPYTLPPADANRP